MFNETLGTGISIVIILVIFAFCVMIFYIIIKDAVSAGTKAIVHELQLQNELLKKQLGKDFK